MTNPSKLTTVSKNRRASTFYDLSKEDVSLAKKDLRRLKNDVRSNIDLMFDGYPSLDSKILIVNHDSIQGVLKDGTLKKVELEDDPYIENLDLFSADLRELRVRTLPYKESFSSIPNEFVGDVEKFVSRGEGLMSKILLKVRHRKGCYLMEEIKAISEGESGTDVLSLLHTVRDDKYKGVIRNQVTRLSNYYVKGDRKVVCEDLFSFFLKLSDYYSLLEYEEQLHVLKHSSYLRARQLKPIVLIGKQDGRQVLKEYTFDKGNSFN